MAACQLTLVGEQLQQLAVALGKRAGEEQARTGLENRGFQTGVIDHALTKLSEERRLLIGEALSCPDSGHISSEWNAAVAGAMQRAYLRTTDGKLADARMTFAVNRGVRALVGLGMFAMMAQEGHLRRIDGVAAACAQAD